MTYDGDFQAVGRLGRDAEVYGVVLQQQIAGLVVRHVALRVFSQRLDQGQAEERQQRKPVVRVPAGVQVFAQGLELGDVDFLDVGKMRDLALRRRHALGDDAPQPDNLDFLDVRRRRRAGDDGGSRRACFQEVVEILAEDTPTRLGPRHEREINVGFLCAATDSRRRHHARAINGFDSACIDFRYGIGRSGRHSRWLCGRFFGRR